MADFSFLNKKFLKLILMMKQSASNSCEYKKVIKWYGYLSSLQFPTRLSKQGYTGCHFLGNYGKSTYCLLVSFKISCACGWLFTHGHIRIIMFHTLNFFWYKTITFWKNQSRKKHIFSRLVMRPKISDVMSEIYPCRK